MHPNLVVCKAATHKDLSKLIPLRTVGFQRTLQNGHTGHPARKNTKKRAVCSCCMIDSPVTSLKYKLDGEGRRKRRGWLIPTEAISRYVDGVMIYESE